MTTVDGAADLLAAELRAVGATSISVIGSDSVRCWLRTKINNLYGLRCCAGVGVVLGPASESVPGLTALYASLDHGVLAVFGRDRPIRFRVGMQRADERRSLIATVHDQTGWTNDPGDWQVNLTRRGGQWIAEVGYLHDSRRLGRLRRQPWSTNPVLAEVLVRLAKITTGQRVHDPCCGTGTLLIAAHRCDPTLRLSGTDHDRQTLGLARANLDDCQVSAELSLVDATPFRYPDGSIDRVLSNLPFGKQVGSHTDNVRLYPAIVAETARTLGPRGRAVLLTEDKRLLADAVARTPGIKIIRERILRYGGATPSAYMITRTRRR